MKSFLVVFGVLALVLGSDPALARSWSARVQDDYPPKALMRGEQGTVYITVTVGVDGRAKDCVVTKSSGFRDLDEATCDRFTKYARFNPATDEKGNPKESSFSTKFTWKIG